MEKLLRPYGIVIDGRLDVGLELLMFDGAIQEVRPHSGIPEPYVISPAFVNAHSHLEYRGLQGKLQASEYWPWIREIRDAKEKQRLEDVVADAILGAQENRRSGVAIIGEHSDRPVAGKALKRAGLGGVIFQEVITRSSPETAPEKLLTAQANAESQGSEASVPSFTIPHTYHTVDEATLLRFGQTKSPISIHVAESDLENLFTLNDSGSIADTYRSYSVSYRPTGKRLVPTLDDLGLVRPNAQFVHCCAINEKEVELLASRRVSVAHCPRSNVALNCPGAPMREMLDSGIQVGLGLDSPASSGAIDMFAEMRSALQVSLERGRALSPEEVWHLATGRGAESLRFAIPGLPAWRIEPGSAVPLIRIHVTDAHSTDDLIAKGSPDKIAWL